MPAYYNEFDPYAAQWLRRLIAAGHLPAGDVDDRSIVDVRPADLRGYAQCHFFAGIGGWPYALRLAGWPDDRPVWTGSCPCQPFSVAGLKRGSEDERHLWPAFFRLIKECRPPVVFGEQVDAAIRHGWLDLVQDDMEGIGYTFEAVGLPAACVGAPHIRQRLWFVAERLADADGRQLAGQSILRGVERDGQNARRPEGSGSAPACRDHGGLADNDGNRRAPGCSAAAAMGQGQAPVASRGDGFSGMGQSDREQSGRHAGTGVGAEGEGEGERSATRRSGDVLGAPSAVGGMGDDDGEGLEGRRAESECAGEHAARPAGLDGFWRDVEWIACTDGKARPTQSGLFPLAHGVSGRMVVGRTVGQSDAALLTPEEAEHVYNRVGVLRGAGNAIVPQVAAAFIEEWLADER